MYDQVVDYLVQIVQLQSILRLHECIGRPSPVETEIFEMSYVTDNLYCFSSGETYIGCCVR